ncbi:MAG: phospholipase D-like domain-containing protein [Syntrophales bacterium]
MDQTPIRTRGRFLRMIRLLRRFRTAELPPTYRRNRVELFSEGAAMFRALHAALRSAERFILAEYYLIHNDRTGAAFADELAAAVRRGVRVWLIYDYVGCIDTPASFFDRLAWQGVAVIPFNVPSFQRGLHWFDRRSHRKMTIIDGTRAFLGGFNIGDEYAGLAKGPRRFHDLGFSIAGTAVGELVRIFAKAWLMEQGETLPRPPVKSPAEREAPADARANVTIVSGGPHQARSAIGGAFFVSIASAAEEIVVVTPYFIPGLRLLRSLMRASRRGVRVRLLLPAHSDVPLVQLLGRSYYGPLLKNGAEIYELQREVLHAKVMLIDGARTVVGSANLDQRSFHRNFEINLIVDDASFSGQVKAVLRKDFADSRRISLDDHERRGILVRLLERVIEPFGWFL